MGGFSNSGVAGALDSTIQERRQEGIDDQHALRDKEANQIEAAITGIQARTDLSPQEKAGQIDAARQQLQKLYKPHEGQHLFERLERIFKHDKTGAGGAASTVVPGAPATSVGGVTLPASPSSTVELKPGLTIAEVLAAGSPQAKQPKVIGSPIKNADGKYYVVTEDAQGNLAKKEVPGMTEESEKQALMSAGLSEEDAGKALRVKYGLEPKAATKAKGYKFDTATGEVVNQDTGERYSQKQLSDGKAPTEAIEMWTDAKDVAKKKDATALTRFHERLALQSNAISAAISKGDYKEAHKEVTKVKGDLVAARRRLFTMNKNMEEITENPANQQAMLSLVANHIGMTLGGQKGARITRAIWEEAIQSAPWLQRADAKFVWQKDPSTGLPVEILQEVYISPEQAEQMVGLGKDVVEGLENSVTDVQNEFGEDLGEGDALKKKSKGGTPGTDVIYAKDPQGKVHKAKKGTALPKGWTLTSAPAGQ